MIFKEISTPKTQLHLPNPIYTSFHKLFGLPKFKYEINERAKWFTWSDSFRELFPIIRDEVDILFQNSKLYKQEGKELRMTYSLEISAITNKDLNIKIEPFVQDFVSFDVKDDIYFFSDLLDNVFDSKCLHFFFSYVRSRIIERTNNLKDSLYVPLGIYGSFVKDFPLHADLYYPTQFFLVFENVKDPKNNSFKGESTFMDLETLISVLDNTNGISREIRNEVISCFDVVVKEGAFSNLMNLLYNKNNPWHDELQVKLGNNVNRILLSQGQGYMINDRKWLHGRERIDGGVPKNRLHRLTYNLQ